jgi:RimJ/RimL family protein N-acetyltransferase
MIRLDNTEDGRAISNPPDAYNPAIDRVIASVRGDTLLGGFTYEKFNGASIVMHVRSFDPHWLSQDLLWVAFHYPFVQLGCKMALGFIRSSNQKALAFVNKLGFKEEHRIRDACPHGDLVVLTMRREECRWLSIKPKGIRWGNE